MHSQEVPPCHIVQPREKNVEEGVCMQGYCLNIHTSKKMLRKDMPKIDNVGLVAYREWKG